MKLDTFIENVITQSYLAYVVGGNVESGKIYSLGMIGIQFHWKIG